MKNNILTIARKELARFFSNKASAFVAILLPGLLIFGMYSFMGSALSNMFGDDEVETTSIAVVGLPQSVEEMGKSADIDFITLDSAPDATEIREKIDAQEYQLAAVFPDDFDAEVFDYDPANGTAAPQVSIFFDSTNTGSTSAYTLLISLLDAYESSLSNRFDINAGEETYDVANDQDRATAFIVSIVPMLLLMLLFSSCMALGAEAIAGEKERGTMATLLATPINRRDIALGKILALSLVGMMAATSSAVGLFASLPQLMQGAVDLNIYGVADYALLALVIFSTTLVVVMLIALISALAKTTKEAQLYLTPLMIVVVLVGLLGMFQNGASTETAMYLIPLYNSVQCMIGILTFDFQPVNVIICVVSNVIYTGIGVIVLQKMFNSERLMFAR